MSTIWQRITIGFILFYTFAAITVSLNRYWQYQTGYYDFGIIDAAIWKVSRFEAPIINDHQFNTETSWIFATHFSPSVFLLAPLYWLTDKQEIMLLAQSILIGIAAFFAYKMSSNRLKSKVATFALVFAFLGYVGLQNALISEFHETALSVLPIVALFWAIYNKKWKSYFLFLIILFGIKESFAGFGVAMAIYIFLRDRKDFKIALITLLLSLCYGWIVLKFVIPYFSGGRYIYYNPSAESLPSAVNNFFFPELKWKTIWYTFLTFGFLPIFNISLLPAILENFLERFVLTSFSSRWDLGMHYNSPLSPLMFFSSLEVLIWMEKRKRFKKMVLVWALATILIVTILHRFILRGPLGLFYNPVFYEQNAHVKYMDDFLKQIPKEGKIYTQNDIAGRLAHREVRTFREEYRFINPDHVVLNLTPGQNPNAFSPLREDTVTKLKNDLINDPEYSLKKYGDELYIFSKNN